MKDEIVGKLVHILREIGEDFKEKSPQTLTETTLKELGLDSVAIFSFLVGIEDAFGIEWNDDVPLDSLDSIPSIASYLHQELV